MQYGNIELDHQAFLCGDVTLVCHNQLSFGGQPVDPADHRVVEMQTRSKDLALDLAESGANADASWEVKAMSSGRVSNGKDKSLEC